MGLYRLEQITGKYHQTTVVILISQLCSYPDSGQVCLCSAADRGKKLMSSLSLRFTILSKDNDYVICSDLSISCSAVCNSKHEVRNSDAFHSTAVHPRTVFQVTSNLQLTQIDYHLPFCLLSPLSQKVSSDWA